MFFSRLFFPTDNLPLILRALAEYLALSPMRETFRGPVNGAWPLTDFPIQLSVLADRLLRTATVAVKTFRFR